MITVDEVKRCKHITNDLIKAVKDKLGAWPSYCEKDLIENGEMDFEYNKASYGFFVIDESSWDDEGKYQFQNITYQLVSYDPTNIGYPCGDNVLDKFDLILTMSVTRSGSYFSNYEYFYDKPILSIVEIEHIPEQIIPAHEDIKLVECRFKVRRMRTIWQ